jgi:transposase
MHVLYPRCCGLDIHQKTIVAGLLLTDPDGATQRFVRTFGTMTADLLALGDWLEFHAVTHVAMESTGVLWRPVFNVLEEGRTLILVTAQHIKAVPGRKTDVKESEWLADLLRHGLLRPRFIPPQPIRVLRDLTRRSQSARRTAHPRDQSRPQGAGNGHPQIGGGGQQGGGREWAADAAGDRAGRIRLPGLG